MKINILNNSILLFLLILVTLVSINLNAFAQTATEDIVESKKIVSDPPSDTLSVTPNETKSENERVKNKASNNTVNNLPNLTKKDKKQSLKEATENGKKTIIINGVPNLNNTQTPKKTDIPKKPGIKNILLNKKKEIKLKSIMLNDDEKNKLQEALNALKNKKPLQAEKKVEKTKPDQKTEIIPVKQQSRMYLDAILFISEINWIAWINGVKIIAEDNVPSNPIYIKSISNNKAKIKWTMGISKWRVLTGKQIVNEEIYYINKKTNQIEVEVTLRTNQTYSLITNQVTEGRF